MQQAHMWIDALDDFTVQLHHHAKHAMGSRMLRAKVDGVILNLDFVGNRGITLRQFFRCGRHDFFPSSALTGDGAPGASGFAFSSPGSTWAAPSHGDVKSKVRKSCASLTEIGRAHV